MPDSSKAIGRPTQVSDFLTGNRTASVIPWDPNCTKFPIRKDVPRREDAPEGAAWVWGQDDYIERINLLTPVRVSAAGKEVQTGEIVSLNLPLNVPNVPAFGREQFQHTIKLLAAGVSYDEKHNFDTQAGTQWDGFRHMAHMTSQKFYNGTTSKDIEGPDTNHRCSIHY